MNFVSFANGCVVVFLHMELVSSVYLFFFPVWNCILSIDLVSFAYDFGWICFDLRLDLVSFVYGFSFLLIMDLVSFEYVFFF